MLTAQIRWTSGRQFVAESGSGHGIVMDAAPDFGGRDTGMRPMELMLVGLAGCSAIDVQYILADRMHEPLERLAVSAEADRAEEHPMVFTEVRLFYRLEGPGLREQKVSRAIALSMTTYCSASAMIKKTAPVIATYEIRDTGTGELTKGRVATEGVKEER